MLTVYNIRLRDQRPARHKQSRPQNIERNKNRRADPLLCCPYLSQKLMTRVIFATKNQTNPANYSSIMKPAGSDQPGHQHTVGKSGVSNQHYLNIFK